jgi:biotin carboxylase
VTHLRNPGIFVQIGATRDGLDPYLREARERSMQAILIETPAYLHLRAQLGRQPFDLELAIADPSNAGEVSRALAEHAAGITLVLAGFERYVASAFATAKALGITLARDAKHRVFLPPDKAAQRALLSERAPEVLQPGNVSVPLARGGELATLVELKRLAYPLVVKPSDGGGGLGVYLVESRDDLQVAVDRLCAMQNYGGGAFSQLVAEEYVQGVEFSVQAVAFRGQAILLTVCEKLIVREWSRQRQGITGFREAAHIAQPGAAAATSVAELAQRCVDAMGYDTGPFHIDLIRNAHGDHFVEMGFRLSGGGIVGLVERTAGVRWGALVFELHVDDRFPTLPNPKDAAVGLVTLANDAELAFFREKKAGGDALELYEFAAARPAAGRVDDGVLSSDRLRHGGMKGRVFLQARDSAEIRQCFRTGIHTRLEHGACAD